MKDDMQVELIQKINKIVNKIIRKLEITEVSYSMWNSYYNLLLKLIYNKVPTVSYYEFATALCLANVSFKTKEEEKMFIKQKDGLGKSISMAMQLSKTTNEDISFSLYNTTTLRESIEELMELVEKDKLDKKNPYIGKDGFDYFDLESLKKADDDYMKLKYPTKQDSYINNNIEIVDYNKGSRKF